MAADVRVSLDLLGAIFVFKFGISLFGFPLINAFDISKFMLSERSSYMVSDVRKGHKLSEVPRLSTIFCDQIWK